jgi:CO/xanthine dehydrogenase FAD-binding subunit
MILEYHRPETIDQAVHLLKRADPPTLPMGGGTFLNRPHSDDFAVVDLQALGLDFLEPRGSWLDIGATFTLQALFVRSAQKGDDGIRLPAALAEVLDHEKSYHLRQVSTAAGTLVAADGRSPFAAAMLALDASLLLLPGDETLSLGNLFPLRAELLRGRLIKMITVPLNARLAYHVVGRTPADRPLVCAAAAAWPSGRRRVALGGYGAEPKMAFDGMDAAGAEAAARSAYLAAGDEWASAEYRAEMAEVLTRRCLEELA